METGKTGLVLSEELSAILEGRQAVVALESTIITHGMPWPRNLEMARHAERAVRDAGAVPATVAVLDGQLRVGLSEGELERLARSGAGKCSRRDLPVFLANGGTAGTTVAATMIAAHRAGIAVFATGGIGGVHRGAEQNFDISADLHELARTPVAVVCSGPKAILDIGLTLEFLETRGVTVVGLGVDELPAFWCRESGFPVDTRLDTATDVARLLQARWGLGLSGGVVIANPVPVEHAMDRARVEQVIATAHAEAAAAGVHGKALTPFLLARVEALTEGASLDANVALMLDNARRAAAIAVALARAPS